jgi:hypothetical protein
MAVVAAADDFVHARGSRHAVAPVAPVREAPHLCRFCYTARRVPDLAAACLTSPPLAAAPGRAWPRPAAREGAR